MSDEEVVQATGLPAPNTGDAVGNIQFGRTVFIEILDFKSKVKTRIEGDFEIEFSFFKTIDHVKEDDMGQVKVYGLTKERIKSFQESGGEIRVYAGYKYSEVVPVFIGYITRLYGKIENNITVLTIECSSNLMNHYITGRSAPDGTAITTVGRYMNNLARITGFPNAVFDANKVPDSDKQTVSDFLNFYPATNYFIGDLHTLTLRVTEVYGFEIMSTEVDGVKTYLVVIGDKALQTIKRLAKANYPVVVPKDSIENVIHFTQETDATLNDAVVLDHKTGLISSSIEYKITKAFADQQLGANETETAQSEVDRASSLASYVEKEEEKRKKAEAKGKEYVAGTPPKSITQKYVNRKYNKVRALFNPRVRPQGLVVVYDSFEGTYSVFRIRNMTITCNNKKGDWIMELDCEDSANLALTADQIKQLESMEEEELVVSQPQQAQPTSNLSGGNVGRRDIAMRFFMSKGWTKNQSAGIVANLEAESSTKLDHTASKSDEGAYGIAQWRGTRQTTFTKVFGKSIKQSSFEEQLAYVDWELRNSHVSAGNRLRASSSAYDAGSIITIYYEIPSDRFERAKVRGRKAEAIAKTY